MQNGIRFSVRSNMSAMAFILSLTGAMPIQTVPRPRHVAQHHVLGSGRKVLLPHLRNRHQIPVPQDDDCHRCSGHRASVRRCLGQRIQHFPVVHDDELPGLLVPRRGRVHGGFQYAVDLVLLHLSGHVVPYANPVEQLVRGITVHGWDGPTINVLSMVGRGRPLPGFTCQRNLLRSRSASMMTMTMATAAPAYSIVSSPDPSSCGISWNWASKVMSPVTVIPSVNPFHPVNV